MVLELVVLQGQIVKHIFEVRHSGLCTKYLKFVVKTEGAVLSSVFLQLWN